MEKYIHKTIDYNKSLKIDEDALKEIDSWFVSIGLKAFYSVKTINNMYFDFENIEELLTYNFQNRINSIKISGKDYNKNNNLEINFEIDYYHLFLLYDRIVKISYSTTDENIDILLNEKITRFIKNNKTKNWLIGKLGILFYLAIFLAITLFVLLIMEFIYNESISFNSSVFLIAWFIGIILSILIRKLYKFLSKKYFIPIVFYIGKQKKQWDKIEKIKSNILLGVIIAIIVGIITTAISNLIFK